jgi:hypothetical protein
LAGDWLGGLSLSTCFWYSSSFFLLDIDFFSDDDNEKDMLGEAPETVNDDGLQTDNQEEDSSHHAQYPMIPEADAVIRSAGPVNGRRPGPDSKAAKVTAFSNNEEANPKKH